MWLNDILECFVYLQIVWNGPGARLISVNRSIKELRNSAYAGKVTFSNVSIRNVHRGLKFIGTLISSNHKWYNHRKLYRAFKDFVFDYRTFKNSGSVYSTTFEVVGKIHTFLVNVASGGSRKYICGEGGVSNIYIYML